MRYRPHLDGVRALAVTLVIAFHARLGLFHGGFIGVDIFFVLSGFLVTGILRRDLVANGRVSYRRFAARRVRRILPAAVITLLVTAVVYALVATPAEMLDSLDGFRASFLYVANWFFIHQSTDYFAADINVHPALHFWSLAIEEQFYLCWPVVLTGVFVLTRRAGRYRWWIIRGAIGVGIVASAASAVHLGANDLVRAYYGTDTRAYQLLVGSLLALTPQLLSRESPTWRPYPLLGWCAPVALTALVVLATSAIDVGAITRGIFVAVFAPALILGLEHSGQGATTRLLSAAPVTYLGRISYGMYLWHWPVIVIATHGHRISPLPLFLLTWPLATLLAAVSYHVVEHPIRASRALDRYRVPVIAAGLATSVVAGLVVAPLVLDRGGMVAGTSASLDWRKAKNDTPAMPDCLGKPAERCTVVRGHGLSMLLMGDSNARMWIPAFTEIAEREGLTFSIAAGLACPWQRGLVMAPVAHPSFEPGCRRHQDDWYRRVVKTLDPDIIFLAHQAFDEPKRSFAVSGADGHVHQPGDAGYEPTLEGASSAALRALDRPGRKIVVIEPIPIGSMNPLGCLSRGGSARECGYEANREPTALERFYRSVAHPPDVYTLDLDRVACPSLPVCPEIVGDTIVRRDFSHLTATFVRSRTPVLRELLRAKGIL